MILKKDQISDYHEDECLVIENLFSKSEIEILTEAVKFNQIEKLPNIILKKNGDVHFVFAHHKHSDKYDDLYRQNKSRIVDFEPKEYLMAISASDVITDFKNLLTADLIYSIKRYIITELINKYFVFEASSSAGASVLFHLNLLHASNSNISPYERNTAIVTYNDVDNLLTNTERIRPDNLCFIHFEPMQVMEKNSI